MSLILDTFIRDNKDVFIEKVIRIAGLVLCPKPDWFNILFYLESGINAQAVNWQPGDPGSSNPAHDTDEARRARCPNRATGIFQCMPATAIGLGTTTTKLYNMTNFQQLEYYYMYVHPFKGKIKSFYDLYLINFYPSALGKPDNYQIGGADVAKWNRGLDLDHNGLITVGEFKQSVDNRLRSAKVAFDFVKDFAQKKKD